MMTWVGALVLGAVLLLLGWCAVFGLILAQRNALVWIGSYLRNALRPTPRVRGTRHVLFCFVDHFEPQWHRPTQDVADERVRRWCTEYPAMAAKFKDADGVHPQHCFFFPEEEYQKPHLNDLMTMCKAGFGEVEVHLHHDNDTESGLRDKLQSFCGTLRGHGALPLREGKPTFAFIHGNWCLDNSHPQGKHCGVNNEIQVLAEEGCYADFTLPAAPDPSQTSTINSIYYAKDDPEKPKSQDRGIPVKVGREASGDLMLIQGPLLLNWHNRKWGIFPRIENSDIRANQPPLPTRVDDWVKAHIHVEGRPEWIFVKIHTHGTQEPDIDTLLGQPVHDMFAYLGKAYNDGERYSLHYVTAREMYNIAKAAEAGHSGNPNDYRDFELASPHPRP